MELSTLRDISIITGVGVGIGLGTWIAISEHDQAKSLATLAANSGNAQEQADETVAALTSVTASVQELLKKQQTTQAQPTATAAA
jgi:hypothetical protein